MTNWRLIEAEIESALRTQRCAPYEDGLGDKRCGHVNVTLLARDLSDRFTLLAKPVQVKAEDRS